MVGEEHAQMMRQKHDRLNGFRSHYYRTLPESLRAQRE
jgi:hypothetical protein